MVLQYFLLECLLYLHSHHILRHIPHLDTLLDILHLEYHYTLQFLLDFLLLHLVQNIRQFLLQMIVVVPLLLFDVF